LASAAHGDFRGEKDKIYINQSTGPYMAVDKRIRNEIRHGEYIGAHGEEIWNWSSPAGKRRWARRCRLFETFLGNRHNLVLEIGCGTGLFTKELAGTDNAIVALDVSDLLIMKAKARVFSPNVHFVVGNAYQTGFKSGSFDCIVGSSALHHLDVHGALKEFLRILKSGGRILFMEPNMMNPQVALIKKVPTLKLRAGDSPDETAFFRRRIAKQFEREGFTAVSVKPFDFIHPKLPASVLSAAERLTVFLEKTPLIREFAGSLIIQCRKKES
jgi:SAM-dependent methyltransferase